MTTTGNDDQGTTERTAWRLSPGRSVSLRTPGVMAILNVTPDSFSDGGQLATLEAVVAAATKAVRDGAVILDIGGESTRPGAQPVSAQEQIARVVPAIEAIRAAGISAPITIDTTSAAVARAAINAGADAINDVSGGEADPAMLATAAELGRGIVLMHRLTTPERDSYSDRYSDDPEYTGGVVAAVRGALERLARRALDAGIRPDAIVLDPGLGFGKSVAQNLALVRHTAELAALGYPLLGAASRKSFTARVSMQPGETDPPPPDGRLGASIAFSLAQLRGGVRLFRVHDVAEQGRALRAAWAIERGDRASGSTESQPEHE